MFVVFYKMIICWEELWGNIIGYYYDSEEFLRIKIYLYIGVIYMFI